MKGNHKRLSAHSPECLRAGVPPDLVQHSTLDQAFDFIEPRNGGGHLANVSERFDREPVAEREMLPPFIRSGLKKRLYSPVRQTMEPMSPPLWRLQNAQA